MELEEKRKIPWREVGRLYAEAFPKRERQPFSALRRSVKKGKTRLLTATEGGTLLGFLAAVPYRDTVLIDYLAVSPESRGQGIGGRLLKTLCDRFPDKRAVLLIERPDEKADNREQRLAR